MRDPPLYCVLFAAVSPAAANPAGRSVGRPPPNAGQNAGQRRAYAPMRVWLTLVIAL